MSEMFSLEQIDFGEIPDIYSSSKSIESGDGENLGKQTHLYGKEDWGESRDIDLFCSSFGFYQDNPVEDGILLSKYQQEQQLQFFSDFGVLEDIFFDVLSPPIQPCQEEIAKLASIQTEDLGPVDPKKKGPHAFPSASFGILTNYRSGLRQLNRENIDVPSYGTTCTKVEGRKFSTEAIMRLAGEKFIQSSSQSIGDLPMLGHPFGSSLLGLSDEVTKDVELAQNLLAAAEKVGQQKFNCAINLLNQCDCLSSNTGNPVQRVVYYFSEALRERIYRETGRITSKGLGEKYSIDIEEALMGLNPTCVACHQDMPFSQVGQFTGMQAIIENVAEAKRVHIIDLEIRSGMQWTGLMQALAARHGCPLELLKITAVGTKSKRKIEETGKHLMNFAHSMDLPFSFNVVMVSEMLDLTEDLLELEVGEMIVVYSEYFLWTMIVQPNQLESLMKVIKNIYPCIMVVIEVEANHNSPVFVNRFIETLFFFSTYFDCLEDCMDQDDQNRMITESVYFNHGICNIVAAEGKERTIRQVKVNVWRAFLSRFGMTEIELSPSSLYQASLFKAEDWGDMDCHCSKEAKHSDIPTQISDLVEAKKGSPCPFPLASFELLNKYGSGLKRFNRKELNDLTSDTPCNTISDAPCNTTSSRKLSTEEVLQVAVKEYFHFISGKFDHLSMHIHLFCSSLSGLSYEETRDVRLVYLVLASAEKACEQKFDRAIKLLKGCDWLSSNTGNPVQRVVYYFSEALKQKIDRETRRITSKGFGKKQSFYIEEAMMGLNPALLALHQNMPFSQVGQFTGMQAIIENVAEAKRIHIIDLQIRSGMQWTGLMQALAARYERPLELLKITAVGTKSKPKIEETGKRLMSFAQSMDLTFSFNVVMVSAMLDLTEDLFELEGGEMIAVYSEHFLRTMIAQPNQSEYLMRVIRNINPCIMVVVEVEADHNSPVFVNRFVETLFFYSAYFDCLEDCMDRNDINRMITESVYFSHEIRNILAAKEGERTIQHAKINHWRTLFAQQGMMETQLSTSSLYQASLVVKNFSCGKSCTLDMDGKCLIMGWKGTPMFSLSAWKFL
ncbi:hypothetical protein F0562_034904 [Nyssa sinensis]|uniref:DELLA protein n=1 Tax=Nyssa sinensis TaxID=561372 RepID=A0A5J5ADU8_9ASTE|nr:hypothetical protein F0562_034904 [Nyssa sinensis]